VRALLDQLVVGRPTLNLLPVDVGRRAYAESSAKLIPKPAEPVGVEDRSIEGPAGPLRLRVYTPIAPDGGARPMVVFFHGGGWVVCDLDTHDAVCRRLVLGSGAVVVSVDYRLAPEHRFPAATRWAFANALGVRQRGVARRRSEARRARRRRPRDRAIVRACRWIRERTQ
jgi:acetyl esterase